MKQSFKEFLLLHKLAVELTSRISLILFIIAAFLGPIIPFHGFMFGLIFLIFVVLSVSVRLEYHIDDMEEDDFTTFLKDFKDRLDNRDCEECADKDSCTIKEEKTDEQPV